MLVIGLTPIGAVVKVGLETTEIGLEAGLGTKEVVGTGLGTGVGINELVGTGLGTTLTEVGLGFIILIGGFP